MRTSLLDLLKESAELGELNEMEKHPDLVDEVGKFFVVEKPSKDSTKDDILFLSIWDSVSETFVDDKLFYVPFEVKIKEDLDTTPVVISGSVVSSYPFSFASVDLICGSNYIQDFVGDNVTVNDISELITELNTNTETSYLGTYSDPGDGGVLLTIPTNLVNRFCSNGTLTFEVFAD